MKLLAMIGTGLLAASCGAQEIRVDASIVTATMQALLRQTTMRLNNHGPRHGDSWLVSDSEIRLPPPISMTVPVPIPESRGGPDGAWRIYLSDVRLASVTIGVVSPHIRVRLRFEEDGPEVVTHCVSNFFCFLGSPTAQIHAFQVDVLLRPIVDRGQVTYREALVRTTANASVDCGIVDWLCNEVTKVNNLANDAIVTAFRSAFEAPAVRDLITGELNRVIGTIVNRPVIGIYFAPRRPRGVDLVLRTAGPASADPAVRSWLLTLRTGDDDLRCGGQAFAQVETAAGWTPEAPLTGGRGLAPNSLHTAQLRFRPRRSRGRASFASVTKAVLASRSPTPITGMCGNWFSSTGQTRRPACI